jgi:HAD superfamily phosphoserine phosphatase-like hydrolase
MRKADITACLNLQERYFLDFACLRSSPPTAPAPFLEFDKYDSYDRNGYVLPFSEESETMKTKKTIRYLVASDFDQTLSFNDSGHVLGEIIGVEGFENKVKALSATHLVQSGAELAYLLRHDSEFQDVRPEHLVEAGKRVRLKDNVKLLAEMLAQEVGHAQFQFVVISAGPREVVQSALEGLVPPENIFGTEFVYDASGQKIASVKRVPAGYGKVVVLQELEQKFGTRPDHTVYIGDGSSDLYVMHHVNSRDGHTIAVSETKDIGRIAKRTVLSESATSVFVPILEDILKWDADQIREFFEGHGLSVQGWDKIRTDWLTFHKGPAKPREAAVPK